MIEELEAWLAKDLNLILIAAIIVLDELIGVNKPWLPKDVSDDGIVGEVGRGDGVRCDRAGADRQGEGDYAAVICYHKRRGAILHLHDSAKFYRVLTS